MLHHWVLTPSKGFLAALMVECLRIQVGCRRYGAFAVGMEEMPGIAQPDIC